MKERTGSSRGPLLPTSSECPQNQSFVPPDIRSTVLQWGHTSKVTWHPGYRRTLNLLQQRFWWPSMAADTLEFVSICSVCACSKATHHAPAGLLHPLSIPNCPWSHITVDFVTGLPSSEHNTTILTIVDRFSEAVHFVPLAKLPSVLETAHLLIVHVFRLHDTAQDIMSDQGPRFVSHVWRAFCQSLGTSASLSSGYHPQRNC